MTDDALLQYVVKTLQDNWTDDGEIKSLCKHESFEDFKGRLDKAIKEIEAIDTEHGETFKYGKMVKKIVLEIIRG